MLDYEIHHALMATEEHVRRQRHARSLQRQFERDRPPLEPRPNGRGRWSLAAFVGLLVPNRDAS